MLRLALRTLVARRRRALTTTLAVFLGVALAASTLALTSALEASLSGRASEALADVDVVVAPRQVIEAGPTSDSVPTLPATLLEQARGVDGVALASGQVFAPAWLFDADGEPAGSALAPDLVTSVLPKRLGGQEFLRGRAPRTGGEAAVDDVTAARGGIEVGDRVRASSRGERRDYRVVGVVRLGETPYAGGSVLVLTESAAARLAGRPGINRIVIAAAPGATPERVRDGIARVLPRGAEALTGPQLAQRRADEANERIAVVSAGLWALAGASLFVGAFLIFNTFSITVAQRLRELALLRTIAATRRQVMAIVLLEALGVGIIGSLLGLLGGVGALPLLREAIERLDVALPLDDLAMTTDAIALSVAIGVGVTLAAALVPAWRATRIAPLEALRTAKLPPPRRDPVRTALALVLLAAGAALLSWALLGDLGLATLAPGFFGVVLVGAALLGSRLVVPLALLVALPLQLIYGVSGRIARRNATRHPRRTSATAAALAIVVTIVSFAAVLSASYERTSADTVDFRFQGELVVQGFREGVTLPPEVERALADVPGVAHVGEMAVAQGITEAIDGAIDVNGVDPADAAQTYRFRWRDGSQRTLARLGDRDAVVFHDLADELDVDIGDDVEVLTRTGGSARYRVVGVFIDDPNDQVGELITTRAALRRDFGEHRLLNVAATLAPGAAPDEARRHAKQLIETRFPAARVYDKAELRQVFADEAADFQRMILALLSLAIVISVLGVANTISLSIHERTREIAILRALGATRGQVRAIVHQEGMVTSLVGGSVGAALGAALGGVFVASVAGSGFVFAFPVPVIALIVAATLLAGFLAAALPGRRAAEAPMLEAVADA